MKLCYDLRAGVAVHHVKVKPRCAVLTMLKRLDKIRFRGPRTRDDFPDLAESPPASDNECSDDVQPKPRTVRDTEDLLRDPAGSGSPTMAANNQDFQRSESDRLNEVKGHLEIALLEKHFLRSLSGRLALCPVRNKQSATRAGEENPQFNWQMKSMRRERRTSMNSK